jgi:nitrite reductase/ring-hydroxylating ferredoxin subunit
MTIDEAMSGSDATEDAGAAAPGPQSLDDNQFHLRDVPKDGGLLVADVVAVFALGDRLCATQARCPHKGGPLTEGSLEGHVLTCPWHGAQFDVRTGEVLRGPATRPLEVYPVHVLGELGEIEPE